MTKIWSMKRFVLSAILIAAIAVQSCVDTARIDELDSRITKLESLSYIDAVQDADGRWYWTLNGSWLYVNGAKVPVSVGDGVTPKMKIENGMWYVSYDNGTTWTEAGKATGDDGAACGIVSIKEDSSGIYFEMQDGTVITIAKVLPLTIVFDVDEVGITSGGESKTIGYTLNGASENVVIKAIAHDGWRAKLNVDTKTTGTITITAPEKIVESEVLVLVSDGERTVFAVINCYLKATVVVSSEKYEVPYSGGNVDVTLQTNMDLGVSIPVDAQSWLSLVQTKSMMTKTLSFTILPNDNAYIRNAVVSLVDGNGRAAKTFLVSQEGDTEGLVSIHVDTKGELHSVMESYDKAHIVKMKVSGNLNDVDLLDIYYEMPALRYLDMSDVNIDVLPAECFKNSKVTGIVLPNTVKTLSRACFSSSKISGNLVVPASCETIEPSAFYNCQALETVVFGSGSLLKTIGDNSFEDCTSLKSVVIPAACENIGASAFKNCKLLADVDFEQGSHLKTIGGGYDDFGRDDKKYRGAFNNCVMLKSITIPASCETIGATAFKNCQSLETVVFENNSHLKIIGGGYYSNDYYYGAFSDCTSLKSIIIPASCETIESSAFKECKALENVSFEQYSQLKEIGGGCHMYEYDDGSYFYPHKSVLYYYGAFSDCVSLKSITIPASCQNIGVTAFRNCKSLESVEFSHESVLTILSGGSLTPSSGYVTNGKEDYSIAPPNSSVRDCYSKGVFANCSSLKSVKIPSSITNIDAGCFVNCTSLTDLSFDEGSQLSEIGEAAYMNCGLLHRIYMQNCSKLSSVGNQALYGNDQIYFLQIGTTTPPKLGRDVFGSVGTYSVLKVPAGSEPTYKSASGWSEFSSITAID